MMPGLVSCKAGRGEPRVLCKKVPTCLLAASTGVFADSAVRVHRRMPFALVATACAYRRACLKERPGEPLLIGRLAARDPSRGCAHIGAIQAQTQALDHAGNVRIA